MTEPFFIPSSKILTNFGCPILVVKLQLTDEEEKEYKAILCPKGQNSSIRRSLLQGIGNLRNCHLLAGIRRYEKEKDTSL
ncbi:MAG TPA: hypothetical protein VJ965_08860 [Anaerolineales bacterium]|nr:hypothetical protein [Anaerolineales bacterium]